MRVTCMTRFFLAVFSVTLALGAGAEVGKPLAQQTSRAAGVTVRAQPIDVTPASAAWSFEIALDTHSVELSDDLVRTVTLRAGGKSLLPKTWEGDPPGGHHRRGILRFDPIRPAPEALELRIQRPGEKAPRVFGWRLK